MKNIDWKSSKFYLIPNLVSETVITFKGKIDCLLAFLWDYFISYFLSLSLLEYPGKLYWSYCLYQSSLHHVGNKQAFTEYPLGTYHWHTSSAGHTEETNIISAFIFLYSNGTDILYLTIKTTAESEELGCSLDFFSKQLCSFD